MSVLMVGAFRVIDVELFGEIMQSQFVNILKRKDF